MRRARYSVREAAQRAGVAEAQVLNWIGNGTIRADHDEDDRYGEWKGGWFVPVVEMPVVYALAAGASEAEARAKVQDIYDRLKKREPDKASEAKKPLIPQFKVLSTDGHYEGLVICNCGPYEPPWTAHTENCPLYSGSYDFDARFRHLKGIA